MFWKTLKMELVRAMRPSKIFVALALITILLLGSDWNYFVNAIKNAYDESTGSIDMLLLLMGMDKFKCIIVVILGSVYTGSFCKDDNSHYLRLLLNRVDVTTYIQCRFLANFLVTILVSVVAFYIYVFVMSPLMPLISVNGPGPGHYYMDIVSKHPWLYVGMVGIVFGLVAAACTSIGLLYSAYHADSFVSIAISGLVFFLALSYIPYETPFNMLMITSMGSSIGGNAPWPLMYLWTHVYMLSIIGICGVLFWRRMRWRIENGYL